MTRVVLSLPIIAAFSFFPVLWAIHPNVFIPVSNATCQPGYTWMNNAEQQSPCLTVAYVIAACVGDTWTQPALPSGYKYDPPNGTTATPCYCSWSCYNLMMACTLCQNPAYTSSITTWPSFSENCSLNYKDGMFPQGYVLADNASIPYWATINPVTWPNALFDISQAQNYSDQKQPDYWPSISSPSPSLTSGSSTLSNSDIGTIVGGTVGGIAGLLLVLIGGYFLYRHTRHGRLHHASDVSRHTGTYAASTHGPPPSDPSIMLSPTPAASPAPMSYMNTQSQGLRTSIVSPPTYLSLHQTGSPPADTVSFTITGYPRSQGAPPIPIV